MTWRNGNASDRGYGARWARLREEVLRRDRHVCCCADCRAADRVRPATEVDHVIGKAEWLRRHGSLAGVDDLSNLQSINSECHRAKTDREAGRRTKTRFDPVTGCPIGEHFWNAPKD